MTKTALIICAHSDDQILGVGGTMAKLSDQGYDVHTLIMSYGELSHPHLEEEYIQSVREEESLSANRVVHGSTVTFLGINEGRFRDEQGTAKTTIKEAFAEHNPDIIFTHSPDDFHVDHRSTHDITLAAFDEADQASDVYVFDIWTVWNIEKRGWPRLYVGVDNTYSKKLEALHHFSSQINLFTHAFLNNYVYIKQYITAFVNGLFTDDVFAEVFYKVR